VGEILSKVFKIENCLAPVEFGVLGSYIKTLTTGEKRCPESANISLLKIRLRYLDVT